MNNETKIGLVIVGLIFVGGIVIAIMDSSTELVGQTLYFLYTNMEKGLNVLYIALPVMGILYVIVRFVCYRWINRDAIQATKEARKQHPEFFGEMQSALRSILLPLDFEEQEIKTRDADRREPKKCANFKRGEFTVTLWFYYLNSSYGLETWHWKKNEKGRRKKVKGFSIEGWDITEADKFRNLSVEKLNEWLVEQGIKST